MINKSAHIPIIKNKKLFGKQLQKSGGFDEAKRSMGIDSRAMIYIPEHQILVVAGIHETDEKPQQLTLYKIEATVNEDTIKPRFRHRRRNSQIGGQRSNKKRNSAIYSYSKTSLLENMVKAKLEKNKESDKKGIKTGSGQSQNVGESNEMELTAIMQEAERTLKGRI
jgi:hypothetical protein